MDPTAIILGRLDVLERHREADRSEAKRDRHELANRVTKAIAAIEDDMGKRLLVIERHQNGSGAKAENKWMRYVMAIQGGIIGFLAWLVWGHK